jgi:hypothetical protein
MEVSGQLHAPAALPPGKEPLILSHIKNLKIEIYYIIESTVGDV